MSYSIRPQEMDQVFFATRNELVDWMVQLAGAEAPLDDAKQGMRGSPTVVAQLAVFAEEHESLSRRINSRVDSALYHGREAVDAYLRGDELMAEEYGRAAGVLEGGRLPSNLSRSPDPVPYPPPAVVTGG